MADRELLAPLDLEAQIGLDGLYSKTSARLETYCRLLTKDDENAKDLFQKTYLRIATTVRSDIDKLHLGYVCKTAKSIFLNDLRSSRLRLVRIDEPTMTQKQDGEDGEHHILDEQALKIYDEKKWEIKYHEHLQQFGKVLKRAYVKLSESEIELLTLHHVENLSYDEIATVVGKTSDQVAYEASLAIRKLRYWFTKYDNQRSS